MWASLYLVECIHSNLKQIPWFLLSRDFAENLIPVFKWMRICKVSLLKRSLDEAPLNPVVEREGRAMFLERVWCGGSLSISFFTELSNVLHSHTRQLNGLSTPPAFQSCRLVKNSPPFLCCQKSLLFASALWNELFSPLDLLSPWHYFIPLTSFYLMLFLFYLHISLLS